EPFSGRVPSGDITEPFARWGVEIAESPVAEVIWYAVENPVENTGGHYGEAGYRTIYRRVLLVAPWLNYDHPVQGQPAKRRPGVLRILPRTIDANRVDQALACLIAF